MTSMDADELKEEIAHQRTLQKEYRKRLRVLEQQAAKFGVHAPPHIQVEIDDITEKMQEKEHEIAKLRALLEKANTDLVQAQLSRLAIIIVPRSYPVRLYPTFNAAPTYDRLSAGDRVVVTGFTEDYNLIRWYRLDVFSRNLRNVWFPEHLPPRGQEYATLRLEDNVPLNDLMHIPYNDAMADVPNS